MSNRVLLICGNYSPEPTGIGKYNGEMIEWFADHGMRCTVITTFPYYPDWKVKKQYRFSRFFYKKEIFQSAKANSLPVAIIRVPHYIPTSPTGFKRLLSEFTILFFSFFPWLVLLFTQKFNYVFTVAPPFELGILGVFYKKIRGAKFLYHLQDLQIDAAKELGMIKSSLILKSLFGVEKFILNNADSISSISEGMIQKIKAKCKKDITYFPNWVNINQFFPIVDKVQLKRNYGFKSTDKIILYSGSIGHKQGLETLIELATTFIELDHVKFVICGSGPYKDQLVALKTRLRAENVIFLPLQPFANFNSFLNIADLHLILQKSNASNLMLPSKLSTILSIGGVAIVTANSGCSLFNIMQSSDMGIVIQPENTDALKKAIEFGVSNNLAEKQRNARLYAQQHLSRVKILSHFRNSLLEDESEFKEIPTNEVLLTK